MYHESDGLCPGGAGYIPEGVDPADHTPGGEQRFPAAPSPLYQVGAPRRKDGNYRFVLTEAFAGSKVSPEEVPSAQRANTLAAYAKATASGTAKDVDNKG